MNLLRLFIISFATGILTAYTVIYLEEKKIWNRGKCRCGRKWKKLIHKKNFYKCERCKVYIKLKLNFEEKLWKC